MIAFAQLTENDKRLIIVLIILFILIFVIAGYVGVLIKKIMHSQGKKADDLVHDVVVTGIITNPHKLWRFGIRKNYRYFLKEAWIPFVIMLVASLALILYCTFANNWDINIFDYKTEGFPTLFFLWDFENAKRSLFFGVELISDWPPLLNSPHFEVDAIGSYIFFVGMLVGGLWFLVDVQAYIARSYRLWKLSKTVFNKSLENFDASQLPPAPINPENPDLK